MLILVMARPSIVTASVGVGALAACSGSVTAFTAVDIATTGTSSQVPLWRRRELRPSSFWGLWDSGGELLAPEEYRRVGVWLLGFMRP